MNTDTGTQTTGEQQSKRKTRNPMATQAVISVNWDRLKARGPARTLSLLRRKFPEFRLYRCAGPGFGSPSHIVTAKGTIGTVIVEPYLPIRSNEQRPQDAPDKYQYNSATQQVLHA